ncbi:MAG: hypothetical protein RRX95_00930 [Oscillospiraceae bacterium]
MENYEELYFFLFNRLTDLTAQIQDIQRLAEEIFLRQAEESTDGQKG